MRVFLLFWSERRIQRTQGDAYPVRPIPFGLRPKQRRAAVRAELAHRKFRRCIGLNVRGPGHDTQGTVWYSAIGGKCGTMALLALPAVAVRDCFGRCKQLIADLGAKAASVINLWRTLGHMVTATS